MKHDFGYLRTAILTALTAHGNQVDKLDQPYFLHPLRVMLRASPEARVAAVLHDVIEDTRFTVETLRATGVNETDLQAIVALTRREGEDYFDYVKRAGENPIAKEVKILDLKDNLSRSGELSPEDRSKLVGRYVAAMAMLTGQPIDESTVERLTEERTHGLD